MLRETVKIHQVITAAPGTRAVLEVLNADGTKGRMIEPVILFALVEDLEEGGNRFVIPMDEMGGWFEADVRVNYVKGILAPGQEPEPWMMNVDGNS
jgi:hypothetical protein